MPRVVAYQIVQLEHHLRNILWPVVNRRKYKLKSSKGEIQLDGSKFIFYFSNKFLIKPEVFSEVFFLKTAVFELTHTLVWKVFYQSFWNAAAGILSLFKIFYFFLQRVGKNYKNSCFLVLTPVKNSILHFLIVFRFI